MIYIKINKQDGEYLLVISHEMDGYGNWLPTEIESFQTLEQLKGGLLGLMTATERVVIRAESQFGPLAEDLGLSLLSGEWGRL